MAHPRRGTAIIQAPLGRAVIPFISALLALVGLRHLLLSLYYGAGTGSDFRYFWLAGRAWLERRDPYGPDYPSMGAALIPEGDVPELWVYPPTWWPISSSFALTELERATFVWNIIGIMLCIAASILVIRAFWWAHPDVLGSKTPKYLVGLAAVALPLLHFFIASELEATSLAIALGQSSILVYFGIAALLYGIATASRTICAVGLSIIFLKPTVGVSFAALFLVYSNWSRQALAGAVALSAIFALPALIIEPLSPLEMARNILRYDDQATANLPQAMTGVRIAMWESFGIDIGNLASVCTSALASVVGSLLLKRVHEGEDAGRVLWRCATLTAATALALAPLHFYDFVITACLIPAVLVSRPVFIAAALLGMALIVRADTVGKLTGLYDRAVGIFEGSLLSTVGAFLLLVAALGALAPAAVGRHADLNRARP